MSTIDDMRIVGREIHPKSIFDRCVFMRQGSDPVYCYARLVHVMAQEINRNDPNAYYIQAIHNLYAVFGISGTQENQYKPIIRLKKQGAKQ